MQLKGFVETLSTLGTVELKPKQKVFVTDGNTWREFLCLSHRT
jgi:hypothetical protein